MKTKRGYTVEVRKTADTMWGAMDNGNTRFGICLDGVVITALDVPKTIEVPDGLDDEAFNDWVYSMLKPDAWKETK